MIKIAFPTDDGVTISQHFGRAPYFTVAFIKDDGAVQFAQLPKWHHGQEEGEPHNHAHSHDSMFQPIADCQVLIVGGMGQPAYQAALDQGLQVILTGEKKISSALDAYQAGTLQSDQRRIHMHR